MVQIFHKLPIKSIYKCKLVCKQWSSLISDPFFKSNYDPSSITNHPLNLTMIPPHKFFNPNQYDIDISSMTYEIDKSDNSLVGRPQPLPSNFTSQDCVMVFGSWNGLVVMCRYPGDFCLFNPYVAGNEVRVHVPIDEDNANSRSFRDLYGLCHDSVDDEYKAVLSKNSRWSDPHSFYVVSFKDGSWKLKTQPELRQLGPWTEELHNNATIVKGVPYWNCRVGSNGSVFYFDMKSEEFRLAPRVADKEWIVGLGTLDGQLTASVGTTDRGLEVWSLKELENGDCCWSRVFVIANNLGYASILSWMIKDVEVLIDVNRKELMIYNVRDKSLRQLQRRIKRKLYNIVVYIPTLITPRSD